MFFAVRRELNRDLRVGDAIVSVRRELDDEIAMPIRAFSEFGAGHRGDLRRIPEGEAVCAAASA